MSVSNNTTNTFYIYGLPHIIYIYCLTWSMLEYTQVWGRYGWFWTTVNHQPPPADGCIRVELRVFIYTCSLSSKNARLYTPQNVKAKWREARNNKKKLYLLKQNKDKLSIGIKLFTKKDGKRETDKLQTNIQTERRIEGHRVCNITPL